MPTIAPPAQPLKKYPITEGLRANTTTNCSQSRVYDSTENKIVLDVDATGDLTWEFWISFRLPSDFKKFAGASDDLTLRAVQDADSGDGVGDCAITIDVLDSSGTDADDDSVDDEALTGSYATYNCAITGGSFSAGDQIVVKITVQAKSGDSAESGDGVRVTHPDLKYIPK